MIGSWEMLSSARTSEGDWRWYRDARDGIALVIGGALRNEDEEEFWILRNLVRVCPICDLICELEELCWGTYLGRRCLGQGINPKIWGAEYAELKICGMKNSNTVIEKWPSIPTTANSIPAKYVYVSPTNTRLGNLSFNSIQRRRTTNYDTEGPRKRQ
jgi:hypothetical protein